MSHIHHDGQKWYSEEFVEELEAEVERLKKIVDLQRGALDVWKKAYPSADVVKLAVFVRRNSSSSGRPKVE